MKRILLFWMAIGMSTVAFGQNKNVVSAINYYGYYVKDKSGSDLLEAKKYIDLASEHEDSKLNPKTWNFRAQIYQAISDCKDENVKLTAPNALEEAAKAYAQTILLDKRKDYPEASGNLNFCANMFLNRGVSYFNEGNFIQAVENFENSIKINKENFKRVDSIAIFNAAMAANKGNMTEKAKQFMQELIAMNYGGQESGAVNYLMLAGILKKEGNTEQYLSTIASGRTAFPADKDLIIEELNYYLSAGKDKEAIANLDLAIKNDPNNSALHFALGTIYDKLGQYDNAENSYKKAIEIKVDYFDAVYNLGALYYNKGVKQTDIANAIKDDKKYKIESDKADAIFRQSIPYLEKAEEIGTDDKNTMKEMLTTLKSLYAREQNTEKMNAVKEKLKKL